MSRGVDLGGSPSFRTFLLPPMIAPPHPFKLTATRGGTAGLATAPKPGFGSPVAGQLWFARC